VADLCEPDALPGGTFDCVLSTQVLMNVFEIRTGLANMHRALKPGGVLLITVTGVSAIDRPERDRYVDYWRFTDRSLRRLLEELFPPEDVQVRAYGNVLAANAFLYGIAAEELKQAELDAHDPDYQVTVAGRAVKASAT
jgi:SAM-dependent methyltransferase